MFAGVAVIKPGVGTTASVRQPPEERYAVSPSRRRRRASPAWEGRPTIKVATLPGRGLYARHLGHPEGVDGVYRPTVGLPGSAPRRASFDRAWLVEHLDELHAVHVHGVRPGQSTAEVIAPADA